MSDKPITLIIFGASGDLTARKLIPSLYRLDCKERLPDDFTVVGVSRSKLSDDDFRARMKESVQEFAEREWQDSRWESFSQRLFYVPADATKQSGLDDLQQWCEAHNPEGGYLYYLAVAPSLYDGIINNLSAHGLNEESQSWRRLIIEKPFGRDLESAKELNASIRTHFREKQLYRIDHYLGKDTVQNILVFRFANTIFEPIWNHNYIDHVQITVAESVDVVGRGDYYDRAGVLRDMFQNHLFQLLCLVAMEAPARYTADTLRNEKVKVLDSITPSTIDEAKTEMVLGQYQGYHDEAGVEANSKTPTFAAIRLELDNWRWRGVPFYLRSGKAMSARKSEIIVQFRCPPHLMFPLPEGTTLDCNRLSLTIQPDEGIHISFQSKVPDEEGMVLCPANLEFHFQEAYQNIPIPESYERLLLDALHGDAALFMRDDEIERAWAIIDPYIQASESEDAPIPASYPEGSDGPECSDEFLAHDGRTWQTIWSGQSE